MKIYTCEKPCTIGGQIFRIGETIPRELIDPKREKTLLKYGLFSASEAPEPAGPQTPPEPPEKAGEGNEADQPESGETPPEDSEPKPESKDTGKKVKK